MNSVRVPLRGVAILLAPLYFAVDRPSPVTEDAPEYALTHQEVRPFDQQIFAVWSGSKRQGSNGTANIRP